MRIRVRWALAAGLLLPALAMAQVLTGTRWDSLTPAQREALAPLSAQWQAMEPESQDTWAALARRFPTLSQTEQRRLQQRMQQWATLSPTEREAVRRAHEQAQRVPAQDRAAKWERFQALSPDRKQALLERASARREPTAPAAASVPQRPLASAREHLDAQTLLPRRPAPAP